MLACGLLDLCAPPSTSADARDGFAAVAWTHLPRHTPFHLHRVVAAAGRGGSSTAKLRCVLHYFDRVRRSMPDKQTGVLTFTRKVRAVHTMHKEAQSSQGTATHDTERAN